MQSISSVVCSLFSSFIQTPGPSLPPVPAIELDDDLLGLLSRADLALGRLDGITSNLPNPDLFIAMYVRQEAILSSQIEGTQASLTDVLKFEAGESQGVCDVGEVVNYVAAMRHGLEQTALPLSLRLLGEIHGRAAHAQKQTHR
jgi:Fic family protein